MKKIFPLNEPTAADEELIAMKKGAMKSLSAERSRGEIVVVEVNLVGVGNLPFSKSWRYVSVSCFHLWQEASTSICTICAKELPAGPIRAAGPHMHKEGLEAWGWGRWAQIQGGRALQVRDRGALGLWSACQLRVVG